MTVVAFTGSRHPLAAPQKDRLWRLLRVLFGRGARAAHHGCCSGGDEWFALLAGEMAFRVIGHPGNLPRHVSRAAIEVCDEVLDPQINRDRNRAIVRAAEGGYLLAGPGASERSRESARSGTWQTVRMARDRALATAVVMPDGSFTLESWPD